MATVATKSEKIIYWTATGIMLFLMSWSVVMYPIMWESIAEGFEGYGFPGWVPGPLWALKLIGIIVIVTNKYDNLKNWVYAAYYVNMWLAFAAHLATDGVIWHAIAGLVAVPLSYIYSNRVRGRPEKDLFILPERT